MIWNNSINICYECSWNSHDLMKLFSWLKCWCGQLIVVWKKKRFSSSPACILLLDISTSKKKERRYIENRHLSPTDIHWITFRISCKIWIYCWPNDIEMLNVIREKRNKSFIHWIEFSLSIAKCKRFLF